MNDKMELAKVTILVPGGLPDFAAERIGATSDMVRLPKADAGLITPEIARNVRGLAAFSGVGTTFVDALPNLEIMASFGVGYDWLDARHAGASCIMFTNTPDVLTEEVADTTIGMLINTVRELPRAEAYLRDGRWAKEGAYPLTRATLRGRRAGIVGMGRIGQAIARRLEAFGIPVAYHNRRPVDGISYTYHPTLVGLAADVDTLISVLPGGAATQNAVNSEVLKALGGNGVFINIGRGSTVDEPALAEALSSGTILAAGLDVFANEPHVPDALLSLPNASLLPHVGSASVHTRRAMGNLVIDNLIAWFSEGRPITAVPETVHVRPGGRADA